MRPPIVCIALLLLLQPTMLWAQRSNLVEIRNDEKTADSLRGLLPVLPDAKEKVLVYQQLCWNYKNTNLDTSNFYADKGIALAQKIGFNKAVADILRFKGIASWNFMYRNASFDLNTEALKISKKIGDKTGEAFSYDRFGVMHYYKKEYDKALVFFKKSNDIFKEIKNYEGLAYSFSHLNWLFSETREYDKALSYGFKALAVRKQLNDVYGMSTSLNDIGLAYKAKGLVNSAITYTTKALEISRKIKDTQNEAEQVQDLADVYFLHKNYAAALSYATLGYKLGNRNNNARQSAESAKTIAEVSTINKDYPKALAYTNIYHSITDSLFGVETQKAIIEHEINYNYEKQKQKLLARQNLVKFILSLLVLMVTVIAIVIYLSRRRKEKDNQLLTLKNEEIENQKRVLKMQTLQLEQSNKMKNKLFSIISHDLKTPFASTSMVFKLLNDGVVSDVEFKEILPRVSKEFETTSGLIDGLLLWAKSQMEGTILKLETLDIYALSKQQIELYRLTTLEKGISVCYNIRPQTLVTADKAMIEIVLRNLLSNAIKFCSFGDTIKVSTTQHEGEIVISVEDTGVGMPQEK
ncbi:MAG: ATP-binding region ATPase domain protein, partial [Segetibacter sp.]|nr:ATP-binding region ATPase domain protein [Segetibacter sp.]